MASNTLIRTLNDAPIDGNQYARADGNWVEVSTSELGNFSFIGDALTNGSYTPLYIVGTTLWLGSNSSATELRSEITTQPNVTIADIDAADDRAVPTKEWVLDNAGTGDVSEAPVTGLSYIRRNETWEQPYLEVTGQSATSVGVGVGNTSAVNTVSLPLATTSLAGLMAASDKVDLNINNDKVGVPAGGSVHQTLVKNSNTDYDFDWEDFPVKLSSSVTYTYNTGTTADNVRDDIAALPKNLNGKTVRLQIPTGLNWYNGGRQDVHIEDFYNGVIYIDGSSSLDPTSITNGAFVFKNNTATIILEDMKTDSFYRYHRCSELNFVDCTFEDGDSILIYGYGTEALEHPRIQFVTNVRLLACELTGNASASAALIQNHYCDAVVRFEGMVTTGLTNKYPFLMLNTPPAGISTLYSVGVDLTDVSNTVLDSNWFIFEQ